MGPDPKRTAAAVLALSPEKPGVSGGSDDPSGEFDTETAALDAAADELIEATKAGDTSGVARALRAAFRSIRR